MALLKWHRYSKYSSNRELSTFHYGSIKISTAKLLITLPTISTFHYGSIKILILKLGKEK